MGEHDIIRSARAVGAASLLLGAAAVLTACSALGPVPGAGSSATAPATAPAQQPIAATPSETVAAAPTPTLTPVPTTAPTEGADARIAVVPFITTADWDTVAGALDVSAIVPTVVEDGGTCTTTVTSGSTVRTATSAGVAASSYTGCQAVQVTGLTAGTWQVRVAYSSPKSVGASASRTVQAG